MFSPVSPGYLVWSRGLSTGQSAHYSMYISLHHRPLGHQNTEQYTPQHTLHLLLPTAYNNTFFTRTSSNIKGTHLRLDILRVPLIMPSLLLGISALIFVIS